MNNAYKRLKEMKEMGIWFNRVPERPGVYTWESIYAGKRVKEGVMFWHCVRNTWNYLQELKQKAEDANHGRTTG